MIELTAQELYDALMDDGIIGATGTINFGLQNVSVDIGKTDSVGVTLESWIGGWLKENNVYFDQPSNTQDFPDFILNKDNPKEGYLEVKAFNYNNGPGFDIANFESYCDSLLTDAYRLDANYLILAYSMNGSKITIEDMWLKKIWEITGTSSNWPLKVQDKRGTIYNIRPVTWYSNHPASTPPFNNKIEFLKALNETVMAYNENTSSNWLEDVLENYKYHTAEDLKVE